MRASSLYSCSGSVGSSLIPAVKPPLADRLSADDLKEERARQSRERADKSARHASQPSAKKRVAPFGGPHDDASRQRAAVSRR